MNLAIALCAAVLGAFARRFQGGGFFGDEDVPPDQKRIGTQVRRMAYFAAYNALLVYTATQVGIDPWRAFGMALVMLASLFTGWGVPIGAAGGWNKQPLKECWGLDQAADWLTERIAGAPTDNQRLWGVLWLSLHGLLFGGLTALLAWNAWPLLWVMFGPLAWACANWARAEYGDAVRGWRWLEYWHGGLMWGTAVLALL